MIEVYAEFRGFVGPREHGVWGGGELVELFAVAF